MGTLFHKLPYPFKVVLVSGQAALNFRKRYSGDFMQWREKYINLWNQPLDNILQFQEQKLKGLLLECISYSKWYQQKAAEAGISKELINESPRAALQLFPFLTKEERRKWVSEITNNHPDRKTIHVGYTSGTSGSPTVNLTDKDSINAGFGLWSRFHYVIGLPRGIYKNVRFSGKIVVHPAAKKPPFWVYNAIDKQLLVSSYHLAHDHLAAITDKINRFQPQFIDGYPSSIFILADFISRRKIRLSFKPIAIATTAETLFDYQRTLIQEVFGCHVFNQYASSEGGPFITECTQGKLHLNLDSGIFEFFRPDGSIAGPGDIAEMVVTSIRTFKVPLIRYAIKDIVELPQAAEPCPCGCAMPTVLKIIGREDDLLWTEDRGYIGRMDTAYKGLTHIIKSQIIQHTPDLLEVINVTEAGYSEDIEKKFLLNLRERVGNIVQIKFTYVEDIPVGKAGKFDAVIRKFPLSIVGKSTAS